MRIAKFIHSCLLVENGEDRILLDPGTYTFAENAVPIETFDRIAAIVITHRHADHVDAAAVKRIVGRSPSAAVLANADVCALLKESGVSAETFEEGTRRVGGTTLRAIRAEHAALLNAVPPPNVAYVVEEKLLHPGDSFARGLDACRGIPLLALPITAPWTSEIGAGEFAERVAPKAAIPIHDGYVKEPFVRMRHDNWAKHFTAKGVAFRSLLAPGDAIEI
ncbi:MAG TPA: MBL fold metallo-hydrolase [Thermoanaerobaculia bacterium]|jgi:L-ascorbate metabolism protein UlaG (beta-lactamase superfamily)|nr:MBL fold metallo-hydrolase [Thermoanaerobaculia bacterium]